MLSARKKTLTAFEWQVLKATLSIPLGETRTYKWVAQKIGRPKAMRAVGQALSKNPFIPLVPCHRVVQESGKLGGYAGGRKKKENLLKLEEEIARTMKNSAKDVSLKSKLQ